MLTACAGKTAQTTHQASGAVVLALPESSYSDLAKEIAQEEATLLAKSWEEALAARPAVILWVTAPSELSDQAMIAASLALKRHSSLPSVGVLSGATQEEARLLWQRGQVLRARVKSANATRFFAANGEHATAGIPQAQLIALQAGQPPQVTTLDRENFASALRQADYLSFTGHGAERYLRLDAHTQLFARDLPDLSSVVVSTASCQTFRPWSAESIALSFIHQGAAAYAGFVYSPMEGFLIGEFDELPFRYSWPGFTIGNIAALQNRGAMQGFAALPYYFLLGDPRISLRSAPPYELISDEASGGTRTLTYRGAPQGLIPVRVASGGRYSFVEVLGHSAAADGDAFFNARLQIASLGEDKYILFTHSGGDFTLRLHESPPWHWQLTRPLLDAFDDVTLFSPQNGGDIIVLVAGLFCLAWAFLRGWWLRRKQAGLNNRLIARISILTGLGTTLLLGLYQVLRLPHAAITTKPLALSPLWVLGVFLLTSSAGCLYFFTRKWLLRLLALLAAASPALLPAIFSMGVMQGYNLIISKITGAAIYNTHLGSLPLIAAGPWVLLLGLVLYWVEKKNQLYLNETA